MPSTLTITSTDFTSFTALTKIISREVNNNFGVFRGSILPVNPNTSAAADATYQIGSTDYRFTAGHFSGTISAAEFNGTRGVLSATLSADIGVFTYTVTAAEFNGTRGVFSGTVTASELNGASLINATEPYESTSGSFTATITSTYFAINATSGAVTITLPTASGIAGKSFVIKKTSTNTNAVVIDGNSSETIDDTLTVSLIGYNSSIQIISDGSNWKQTSQQNENLNHKIKVGTPNGYGSTDTVIRRYSTVVINTGSPYMTRSSSAENGDTVTINRPGYYFVSTGDYKASGAATAGLSLNSESLTTSINLITTADQLSLVQANSLRMVCSWSGWLDAGDILRSHGTGSADATDAASFFIVNLIGV